MARHDSQATTGSKPRISSRALLRGMALGAAVGLVTVPCCLGLWTWEGAPWNRPSLPELTPAAYDEALRTWRDRGPPSYDLDLLVSGDQTGNIHVEVRDGQVAAMTRDGVTPRQRRTWDYWTIPSQLEIIGEELEQATDPRGQFGGQPGSQLVLRAQFDPEYGYPRQYQRILLGARHEVRWQVTRFEPRP